MTSLKRMGSVAGFVSTVVMGRMPQSCAGPKRFLNVGWQSSLSNCQKKGGGQPSAVGLFCDRCLMHEVSIMEEAVRLAVDAAKATGARRVVGLRLRVGTLSGAVPDALRFAFDVVCRNTMADGASLEIEPVPAAAWCATCAE